MERNVCGNLTVIRRSGSNSRGDSLWECECSCGNKKIVKGYNLRIGKTKSCGCEKTGPKPDTHINKKYGRLLVLRFIKNSKCRDQILECLCDCGNKSEVFLKNLKNGKTSSCGCYNKEVRRNACGINSPCYNPLLTDEDRITGRFLEVYKKWSKEVKERDEFVCGVCKHSHSGNMVSHHLDGYHWFKEGRCDINNGVCLCKFCHKNFHDKYGRKFNTREQYIEFLENYEIENIRKC